MTTALRPDRYAPQGRRDAGWPANPRDDGRPANGARHHLWCFIRQWRVTKALWIALAVASVWAYVAGRAGEVWIAGSAFGLALLPAAFEGLTQIRLQRGFVFACGLYAVLTVMLGELADLYQRVAWWDVAMHAASGAVLALMGLVIALTLLGRSRAAVGPSLPLAFALCFAAGIAGVWEMFEFVLDERFGFRTQNESLHDTMHDIIVGCSAALVATLAAAAHLLGLPTGPLGPMIEGAVRENARID